HEVHAEAAKALAKKFPKAVKLRNKWNNKESRLEVDVTMHMKKAFGDKNLGDKYGKINTT
ncbi:MAG: hypothetical protein GY861_28560, partial [bacterium]|nr:hypothetical protein [bacterium]